MRKNNKRFMAAALSAAMVLTMTGCGKKTSDEKEANIKQDKISIVNDDITEAGGYDYDNSKNCDIAEEVGYDGYYDEYCEEYYEEYNTNEYTNFDENGWMNTSASPLSTFAADVDIASYSEIRSAIINGYTLDPSMVRIEEMINYFHYDYEKPAEEDKFAVYTEYADCPWNEDTKLALVSLNTASIDFSEAPASNIVFLIDTSGSMFDSNKLPLVQQSLIMLAENFTENDRISIVTYAGSDTVVLDGVCGDKYYEIAAAIEGLEANGSTNGSAGIETAYELAKKHFIKGGNNRVILATDGDLNVGLTSEGELERLIEKKKESGVFLSVIGVGNGNYKDNKLEILADKGNGNYAYIDSIFEAKKTLVENLGATMVTVAKDVKLQVEFNPALVKGYRLIGYENRVMAAEDFNDDTKDGGEMGAGHSVTAIYEIALADSEQEIADVELKYDTAKTEYEFTDELFTVGVRYKEIDSDESSLMTFVCKSDDYNKQGSDNLRWAAAVAEFGMLLRDSEYKGSASYDEVVELSQKLAKDDEYKKEFVSLVMSVKEGENLYYK